MCRQRQSLEGYAAASPGPPGAPSSWKRQEGFSPKLWREHPGNTLILDF